MKLPLHWYYKKFDNLQVLYVKGTILLQISLKVIPYLLPTALVVINIGTFWLAKD